MTRVPPLKMDPFHASHCHAGPPNKDSSFHNNYDVRSCKQKYKLPLEEPVTNFGTYHSIIIPPPFVYILLSKLNIEIYLHTI
jgi:hypothetical protein